MIKDVLIFADIKKVEQKQQQTYLHCSSGSFDLPFTSNDFILLLDNLTSVGISFEQYSNLKEDKNKKVWATFLFNLLEKHFLMHFSFFYENYKFKGNFLPPVDPALTFSFSKQHVIYQKDNKVNLENVLSRKKLSSEENVSLSTFCKVLENKKVKKLLASLNNNKYSSKNLVVHEDLFISHSTEHGANRLLNLGKKELYDESLYIKSEDANEFLNLDYLPNKEDLYNSFKYRRTIREDQKKNLNLNDLKNCLAYLFQNIKDESYPRGFRRPYPSGGGFYETEALLVLPDSLESDGGLYRFNNEDCKFEILEKGAHFSKEIMNTKTDKASILLVCNLDYLRNKYEDISLKIAYQNAGVILSYLYIILGSDRLLKIVEKNQDEDYRLLLTGQFNIV
jgi:hypothetical protein